MFPLQPGGKPLSLLHHAQHGQVHQIGYLQTSARVLRAGCQPADAVILGKGAGLSNQPSHIFGLLHRLSHAITVCSNPNQQMIFMMDIDDGVTISTDKNSGIFVVPQAPLQQRHVLHGAELFTRQVAHGK